MNQKIGNWPGVTLEKKTGIIKNTKNEIIDLPGVYSLIPYTLEEKITRDYIAQDDLDLVINIVDSTSIQRGLYLTMQLLDSNVKTILVLNKMNVLESKNINIDINKLSSMLGVTIVCIYKPTKVAVEEIVKKINEIKNFKNKKVKIIESVDENYIISKYKIIDEMCKKCITKSKSKADVNKYIDKIVLNKYLAIPIFIIIMTIIYYLSVGVVGKYSLNFFDDILSNIKINAEFIFKVAGVSNWLISLISDGIIAGVGSVLSFLPSLCMLFFSISILESTGYMPRVSFIFDNFLRKIGISGKSLIPFIVGTGCSVPGIMSSRILENNYDRNVSAMLTSFIPCTAKLPIIALFAGYFYNDNYGLISCSFYLLSIIIIIVSALIIKKIIKPKDNLIYISELPEYRLPNFKNIIKDVKEKIKEFVKKAGTLIFIASIIEWLLLSFSIDFEYGVPMENSILAFIGKKIAFVFSPMLGVNSWEASVSALQGIVAKEQVISSLEIISRISSRCKSTFEIFGAGGSFDFFNKASSYAFITFNLFSAPCIAAISTMKKEIGAKKMLIMIIYQIAISWVLAVFLYNFLKIFI